MLDVGGGGGGGGVGIAQGTVSWFDAACSPLIDAVALTVSLPWALPA